MKNLVYVHSEDVHNLDSPSTIVPVLCDFLNPSSVVDLGCGIGTFLHCFKKNGVNRVLGIDGTWANKEMIRKHLKDEEFFEANIEEIIEINQKFDLAICLEVAEHVDAKYAENIVKTLTDLSDVIVFSAALPNQGGQNHINEQPPWYWEEKFNKFGYKFIDCLRDVFWDNKDVFWWYSQNMFLVVKDDHNIDFNKIKKTEDKAQHRIHPELFKSIINKTLIAENKLANIERGDIGIKNYLKLLFLAIKKKYAPFFNK
jgi:SAM-dependent methyltransferase